MTLLTVVVRDRCHLKHYKHVKCVREGLYIFWKVLCVCFGRGGVSPMYLEDLNLTQVLH